MNVIHNDIKRGETMKTVKFIDDDEELVERIKEYQKAHGLSSFTAAVRKLCKDALAVAEITH